MIGQFDWQSNMLVGEGGPAGHLKLSTTFLIHSQRVNAYLLLRYCIKNQSIGVA